MALRWSKTEGAYRKYSYIFSKPLPFKIDSNAPISEASYIRDVISYAHENGLPGGEWYKKVTVSPQEDGTVLLKPKKSASLDAAKRYPTNTVFDLLQMLGDNKIESGYRCYITDPLQEVKDMLAGFTKWEVIEVDKYTIEMRERK